MPKFLYVFAYELPGVAAMDQRIKKGWKDSEYIFIESESHEQAKQWGDVLAQEYVNILYQNPDEYAKALGLTAWFSGRIEEDPHPWVKEHLQSITVVKYKERPDLMKWVHERYGLGPY